jgi:antitoxin VapB
MSSVTLRPLDPRTRFSFPQQASKSEQFVSQLRPQRLLCARRFVLSPNTERVYTSGIDQEEIVTTTAKLFKNGRSQAVRLPREFRFEGDRVRVRRAGRGVLVEPVATDVTAWFAELDRLASEPFLPEGRQQPPTPERDVFE